MNAKQTAPLIATLAPLALEIAPFIPPLLIGGGIFFGLKWLLSDDEEKKLETVSIPAAPEHPAICPQISAGNTVQNREISPVSAGKPSATPAPSGSVSVVPVSSIPTVPKNSAPIPKIPIAPPSAVPTVKIQTGISPPARKKIISREDMAKIFNGGCGLTRKSAVSALKALGFGKTAAYQALEINGRFAPWLQFASDGIIIWKN